MCFATGGPGTPPYNLPGNGSPGPGHRLPLPSAVFPPYGEAVVQFPPHLGKPPRLGSQRSWPTTLMLSLLL